MHVMIVDDQPQIRTVLGDFLTDCGHVVVKAGDGGDALAKLENAQPIDTILSDIRMPIMDGIDFLKGVRVRFPAIPVILMTGHGDEGVARTALQQGAFDYLSKPVRLAELADILARIEERSDLERRAGADYRHLTGSGLAAEPAGGESAAPDFVSPDAELVRGNFLVVDGEGPTSRAIEEILTARGHRSELATGRGQALRRARESVFDVILCASDLADGDGIELVAALGDADPTTVVIVVTSQRDRDTAVRAMRAGARGILTRPLRVGDVEEEIRNALRERKRRVESRLFLGDLMRMRSDLEEKVVERERFLSHLIDSAPLAVISTDASGTILTYNHRAAQIYGFAEAELTGKHLSVLFDPDEGSGLSSGVAHRAQHRNKDGVAVPVLVHAGNILDSRANSIAKLYVVEDQTEREQMEIQLLEAERLSLLGQLAPRVAHEFKTPLQAILGGAKLIELDLEEGEVAHARTLTQSIVASVLQMHALVQQMLDLGKPARNEPEQLNLSEEISVVLDVLRPLKVLQGCEVITRFEPSPAVVADAAQIGQVFRNLIVNAANAMAHSPRRELTLAVRAGSRGSVDCTVEDTGIGISKRHLDRVFQPFFTTGADSTGTGLGLPIVKTILDRHSASIQIESTEGVGTRIALSFPASVAAADPM